MWGAIAPFFGSWMNPRAVTYRQLHDIPADWGTAVNNPGDGVRQYGEMLATAWPSRATPRPDQRSYMVIYMVTAQGEEVVAGIRTPQHLTVAANKQADRH